MVYARLNWITFVMIEMSKLYVLVVWNCESMCGDSLKGGALYQSILVSLSVDFPHKTLGE